jgi:hypothetical protein
VDGITASNNLSIYPKKIINQLFIISLINDLVVNYITCLKLGKFLLVFFFFGAKFFTSYVAFKWVTQTKIISKIKIF